MEIYQLQYRKRFASPCCPARFRLQIRTVFPVLNKSLSRLVFKNVAKKKRPRTLPVSSLLFSLQNWNDWQWSTSYGLYWFLKTLWIKFICCRYHSDILLLCAKSTINVICSRFVTLHTSLFRIQPIVFESRMLYRTLWIALFYKYHRSVVIALKTAQPLSNDVLTEFELYYFYSFQKTASSLRLDNAC